MVLLPILNVKKSYSFSINFKHMSKKILPLFILLTFFFSKSDAQDFLGLSTGNYSGITGVMLQPASIIDSRFKFDINLFSTGVNYSNNYFLLDKDVLLKFNKNKFDDYASFRDQHLSEASLKPGEKVFFNINNRTQLPLSFMATTGKKSAIALNMQFRTMIQGRGISQDFANLAYNNFYNPPTNNTQVDVSGISINSLSWAEVGLTYGRVLYSSDKHFLKAAVTGKYLAGLSSVNLSSGNLKMQVNGDSTFNFNSPNVTYNHNQNADFNKLFDKNFSPDASAFGLDAGLVYEYRGNIDKFKYLKTDDEKSYDALRRDVNKYIFKLGVSLLDVGMFKFDKPANVHSFSADINNWDIRNAHYKTLKNFDTALANRVIANPNDPRSYNIYMPTALSAQLDVKFVKGLFLNVRSYWPVNMGSEPGQRFDKFGYYTITPRFETRHFGIYIPYTVTQRNDFTDYKQHQLGATLRMGPLFIGSSNLGSMLFNNKLRSADVHVGLKVGFTYGKPNKSNRFLNTVFSNDEATKVAPLPQSQKEYEKEIMEKREWQNRQMSDSLSGNTQNKNSLILDYKNGKVYNNPDVKQNVTIINNYYYGNGQEKRDSTTMVQNYYPENYMDSLDAKRLQITRLQNKQVADSMSKINRDSLKIKRQQLDSLIQSMQKLQKQMDSTNKADVENAKDSAVSYNILRIDSLQNANDSLVYAQGSLQAKREDALTVRRNAIKQDSARIDSLVQNNQFSADKKKVESAQDSIITRRDSEIKDSTRVVFNADSLDTKKNKDAVYGQKLQNMQDSLDRMAKRFSKMTDSLTQAKSLAQRRSNDVILVPDENYATAPARIPDNRNTPDTKEYERLQKQQNDLLSQYSRQADALSKDIDRLNTRVSNDRRNSRRNNNFIPVPIPINTSGNSQRQKPPEVANPVTPDTVYVRDSVILRDTIRVKDSLKNLPADSFVSRPVREFSRIDTVRVKEVVEKPAFDYASLPEENILFATGKSSVQQIYDNRLNFIAGVLKKNPGLEVHITGHTDSTGSRAINEKLSLQRAQAVSNFLIKEGVSKKQIIVTSESFENPAVTGNTNAARSQNRRVALKLEKMGD